MADTLEILRRLNAAGVEFIVIGGVAAVAYGSPVSTYDVDICAPMSRDNVVKIVEALTDARPHWRFRPDLGIVRPDDSYLGELKNIYLRTDLGVLDVLGEVPEVCSYTELAADAVPITLNSITCKFISLEKLLAAKRKAGRDRDLQTIAFLEARKQEQDPHCDQ